MRKPLTIILLSFGASTIVLLVGPLLVPVPSLEGTVPVRELAEPYNQFIEVRSIDVLKAASQGEPLIVPLHGFAASVLSWREVLRPLSELGAAVAFVSSLPE